MSFLLSLPMWGAWIEIISNLAPVIGVPVAPCVGAWIEMQTRPSENGHELVAPRVGGVD